MTRSKFRERLQSLINEESMEGGSDTPDFVLATYLDGVLSAFEDAVRGREKWYGREPEETAPPEDDVRPKFLPCQCGHYIDRIAKRPDKDGETWWWCGACGRMATVREEDDFISTWWEPNHALEGVSREDEIEEERQLLRKDDLEVAVKRLMETDCTDDAYDHHARRVWGLLDSGARDTLIGLVRNGPVWDGDLPCKTGRDTLIRLGLAAKAVKEGKQGYQVATYKGWDVCKHWDGNEENSG